MQSEKQVKRRKRRKKRILNFILSVAFISSVFFVVVKAGLENAEIDKQSRNHSLITENPMDSVSGDRKEDFLTILISITDEDELRTDALVLASFDEQNKKISLLNIPRDTLSNATKQNKKITSAYVLGIDHTMDVVKEVTGVMPDNYVTCNLDEILLIAEILGGVTIDVPFDMKYDDPTQDLHIDIKKGVQTLYGEDIIEYLRWRKNNDNVGYPDGDLGRINAFQEFVFAAKDQLLTMENLFKIPEIVKVIFNNTETDLKLTEMIWLAENGSKATDISTDLLPGEDKYIGGVSYYIPHEEEIINLVNEKYNPQTNDIEKLNLYEIK